MVNKKVIFKLYFFLIHDRKISNIESIQKLVYHKKTPSYQEVYLPKESVKYPDSQF